MNAQTVLNPENLYAGRISLETLKAHFETPDQLAHEIMGIEMERDFHGWCKCGTPMFWSYGVDTYSPDPCCANPECGIVGIHAYAHRSLKPLLQRGKIGRCSIPDCAICDSDQLDY